MLALPLRGSTPELYHGKYIAAMFASGEQGAWYDPSDLSTLYQNSAGTKPVTAVGQPVGLMLDKSKGLVLGPELVTNGDFSNGTTGWIAANGATISSENGRLKVVAEGKSGAYTSITCEVGKRYKLTFQGFPDTGTVRITVGSGFAQGNEYDSGVNASVDTAFSVIFTAARTTEVISTWSGSGGTSYYDNLSVRELPGNHATQATTASRPTLSARVNLLTKTEQFDDAAWLKTNATIAANAVVAPDGTTTADTFIPGAGTVFGSSSGVYFNSLNWFSQGVSVAAATYKYRLRVKYAGYDMAQLRVSESSSLSGTNQAVTRVLLSNGAVLTQAGTGNLTNVTGACARTDDGWCDITLTFTSGAAQTLYFGIWAWNTTAITSDGVKGLHIWGADLRVANESASLPPYQRVNTSTDYDTVGFPYYLLFDGVDDWLVTNSINFTATDKMTVFAGVRKLRDSAVGIFLELSANQNTNAGSFLITIPNGANTKFAATLSNGDSKTYNSADYTDSAAPLTTVNTVLFDKALTSTEVTAIRKNGADQSLTRAPNGDTTGNFGNYPLYIGCRVGTLYPFKGHLYGLIVRGAATDDDHLTHAEKYLAYKSGVTL